ncbi:EAL domain-containing protein [Pseudorhodoferax sp. LjRoot39]|uniref:sensor domain-containing phosphodiesterase n=1 Tax=Pseudorhodoferax sp. LjRoot39 TaxID=3342328 RepID=UPI003ED07418
MQTADAQATAGTAAEPAPRPQDADSLESILRIVRRYLGMDVAFVSRFREKDRLLELLDDESHGPLHQGQAIPLTEGYCLKVVRGELPEFIPDTSRNALARALPATSEVPIGSHLSVLIVLPDQHVYGTLCCFSYHTNDTLDERDVQLLRACADFLALHFENTARREREREYTAAAMRAVMAQGAPRIVFQPVYHLPDLHLHGFECLSRFDTEPRRTPDRWFTVAHDAGVGLELELQAIRNALAYLERMPVGPCMNINSSPEMILSGQLLALRDAGHDLSRVVLEITEHAVVRDYAALSLALKPLRAEGVTLAVDDAGAGYSSMRHILSLEPDIIKLDMELTHGIDADPKRKALAKGLTSFAHEIGSLVVAEGVETQAELLALARLGVDCAQGYHLDKPLDFAQALERCRGPIEHGRCG